MLFFPYSPHMGMTYLLLPPATQKTRKRRKKINVNFLQDAILWTELIHRGPFFHVNLLCGGQSDTASECGHPDWRVQESCSPTPFPPRSTQMKRKSSRKTTNLIFHKKMRPSNSKAWISDSYRCHGAFWRRQRECQQEFLWGCLELKSAELNSLFPTPIHHFSLHLLYSWDGARIDLLGRLCYRALPDRMDGDIFMRKSTFIFLICWMVCVLSGWRQREEKWECTPYSGALHCNPFSTSPFEIVGTYTHTCLPSCFSSFWVQDLNCTASHVGSSCL